MDGAPESLQTRATNVRTLGILQVNEATGPSIPLALD
jgi:hypothetical protein